MFSEVSISWKLLKKSGHISTLNMMHCMTSLYFIFALCTGQTRLPREVQFFFTRHDISIWWVQHALEPHSVLACDPRIQCDMWVGFLSNPCARILYLWKSNGRWWPTCSKFQLLHSMLNNWFFCPLFSIIGDEVYLRVLFTVEAMIDIKEKVVAVVKNTDHIELG